MANPVKHVTRLLVVLCIVITVGITIAWNTPPKLRRPAHAHAAPRQVKHDEFATSVSCRTCHPDQYSTWHDSYHRTMAQVATPKAVVAPFEGVTLHDGAVTCELERRDDEYWATIYPSDRPKAAAGDKLLEKRIELTTGSHHMQVYWISHNDRMIELPFYYHIDGQRWIPRSDSVLIPPGETTAELRSAEWRMDCIKCHSLGGQPKLSETNTHLASTVAEFGISCEACHGPGRAHIEHHRNPLNRYKQHLTTEGDPTIINPARLSHVESAEVCGQCHVSFLPANDNDFLANGLRYRAGGDYQASHLVQDFEPKAASTEPKAGGENDLMTYWEDGTCCVGGDEYLGLLKSECYLNGKMSCITCHSMHDSDPSDQLAARMDTDRACLQCHDSYADDIESHTHHPADSAGSRCYNCHMPHTSYALFTAMRSHRVDSPSASVSAESGRPNACNLCHLDQTLQWTSEQLQQWYGQPAATLTPEEQKTAASLLWMMKGHAAQRIITAWHMGWAPAQEASGNDWQAPHLSYLMDDPYAVIRAITHESLKSLPNFDEANIDYDYIGSPPLRSNSQRAVLKWWHAQSAGKARPNAAPLLMNADGSLDQIAVEALLKQRDDSPIVITE